VAARHTVEDERFLEWTSTRHPERRRPTGRERHTVPSWYEWGLRELARAFYVVGVIAVLVFVPIQMEYSWLSYGLPGVLDPTLVGMLIVIFVVACILLAITGYFFLWKEGGWVDRAVARHRETRHATSDKGRES